MPSSIFPFKSGLLYSNFLHPWGCYRLLPSLNKEVLAKLVRKHLESEQALIFFSPYFVHFSFLFLLRTENGALGLVTCGQTWISECQNSRSPWVETFFSGIVRFLLLFRSLTWHMKFRPHAVAVVHLRRRRRKKRLEFSRFSFPHHVQVRH